MNLAVNYSLPTSELLRAGAIKIDTFKCPAWPHVVATAQEIHPTYVHFPLAAGAGIGDAIDAETKQRVDWRTVDALLDQTGTPYVNHLPLKRIREIQVTGIQRIDAHWVALARQRGLDERIIQRFEGQVRDHLPMTNPDWGFFGWALEQIRAGL